jgi:hypothetical protein
VGRILPPQRRRRMQSNDTGVVGLCRSVSRGEQCRADPCCARAGAWFRQFACPCHRPCRSAGMVFDVAPTAGIAAWLSGQVGQFACRAPTGAGQRQPALARHDAGTAIERAAAFRSVAGHAAGAAAAAAPALAAIQGHAAGPAAARTRIFQPVPANAARKAHGIAQAVASDDSGAAPQGRAEIGTAAAAQPAVAGTPSRKSFRRVRVDGGWGEGYPSPQLLALYYRVRTFAGTTSVFTGDSSVRHAPAHPAG